MPADISGTQMNLAALDPHVRVIAERFERETRRRLDDSLPPGPVDQRFVELFLILNGYTLDHADNVTGDGRES
jgi:hypothetical protein